MECSQDFEDASGVLEYNVKIYPTCYEKSFKKATLKPKIENRTLQGKKSQISVQVACGDHIVLISQTDDICFQLIMH